VRIFDAEPEGAKISKKDKSRVEIVGDDGMHIFD
jgi:hypothetical protein